MASERPPTPPRPCLPSPCGVNTYCRERYDSAVCECLPDHRGDPWVGCYPECVANTDCANSQACLRHKCVDPCVGTCGINAMCTVSNHVPICSCPQPLVGDPFTQCKELPGARDTDNPCLPNICGPQTICENVNGQAICRCLPGLQGDPADVAGCHPECVLSSDCPGDKTCVNYRCKNPCLENVCGARATCRAINHSPLCSCPAPLIGNPFVECHEGKEPEPCNPSPCSSNGECRVRAGVAFCVYPECVVNSDCSRDRACYNQKCRDPCLGACGINAICQTVNHNPVCSCPQGYIGSPRIECRIEPIALPKPECIDNSECPNDKTCYNQKCVNPCTLDSCGENSQCHVQFHRAVCSCQEGFTGNAHHYCRELGCRSNDECALSQSCVNSECVDACLITQCGSNARCQVDGFHKARCYCQEGYYGNPYARCERPECTSDSECSYNLACRNERCVSPCECPNSAECRVINHRPSCICPTGYVGDAYVDCRREVLEIPECTSDADCPSKLACFNNVCKNPCAVSKPCITNAMCTVIDTLPMRTMVCECPYNFVGDATKSCVALPSGSTKELCTSDSECPSDRACLNQQCVSPCLANPCAHTAECLVQNHQHVCRCATGYVGNPYVDCQPDTEPHAECRSNSECPSDKACINRICQNPCMNNRCGVNAECVTSQHHPICQCQRGLAGNPQVQCFEVECKSDNDCPYDKSCRNSACVTPCLADNIVCGRGAECVAVAHRAQCSCPAGTQGDARIACTQARCQYNEDCADHEICERFNRVCRPACDEDSCGANAICRAQKHQPRCSCKTGSYGNPYDECEESRNKPPNKPECTEDSQCPALEACMNAVCQDPCALSHICGGDKQCTVLGTVPLRTMICRCPEGHVPDENGKCIKIPINKPECTADEECRENEKCLRGSCFDACHVTRCGYNAQCKAEYHTGKCVCPAGYSGNAYIECSIATQPPIPPIQPECYSNDECSHDRQCINSVCVNPCVLNDVCGQNALCHVDKHAPVCRCPDHYMGDARIECIPPAIVVQCRSNSECAGTESCFNGLCISPCNCGPNAKCYVNDHYPSCACLPGYSGNPQLGCIKLECESDSDCPYSDSCYNNQCINPCVIDNRCAINAECLGKNHRATCRCNPGYMGNPEVLCERPECSSDYDCPANSACRNMRCVNPCVSESPCARNAECFVSNHAATCRCPDHLPTGNPYSYCENKRDQPECRKDMECPSRLACVNEKCVEPCPVIRPCMENAKCSVLDTVPVRTMVCTCPSGWFTDAEGICRPVPIEGRGVCISDDECPDNKSCINRLCREPCSCGANAVCLVKNHRAICSCEPGYEGNPEVACHSVECKRDSECSSDKSCVNNNCVNPCLLADDCGPQAECYVVDHATECRCREGRYGNAAVGSCRVIGCYSNSDCPSEHACVNMQCVNPCLRDDTCSHRAECQVRNHLPVCRCPPGYRGNPYEACEPEPIPECREDADCPGLLACLNNHCQNPCAVIEPCYSPATCLVRPDLPVRTMVCECPPGYVSSGSGTCKHKPAIRSECRSDSDCSSDRACVNGICVEPCNCGTNAVCHVFDHRAVCTCIHGYEGNPEVECVPSGDCRSDSDCPGTHECINQLCVEVCTPSLEYCGKNADCCGISHKAVCECPPGTTGNPFHLCAPIIGCRKDSECASDKSCINERCENPCTVNNPCDKDDECHVYDHKVECACPPGQITTAVGLCLPIIGCRSDDECPHHEACINEKCVNPCEEINPCGINAICEVLDTAHFKTMECKCLPGYKGNPLERCDTRCTLQYGQIRDEYGNCVCGPNFTTDEHGECKEPTILRRFNNFKKNMSVKCLSDGVSVRLSGEGEPFDGIMYVKYYSSDEECRRSLTLFKDEPINEEFKVSFGTCGLTHVNGVAMFTLIIQSHKKLMTYNAQAYSIKCIYQIGEQNITLGFNVSMMTTAGTIANTGPPPVCTMKIISENGSNVNEAEIGDGLRLEVEVTPTTIYGGFARSCVAKTSDNNTENEYLVTDENGCATDPTIFGEWQQDDEQKLTASFNAFKFPSSDNIRFQCNIRVCFGRCQPVNCRGLNAFGRKRRDTIGDNDTAMNLPDNVIGDERGNIEVSSNLIRTVERREDRYSLYPPSDPAPRLSEDVCVSMIGFIISLILTALLALVAVAIAVSCWLMAYRRQPKTAGPLPHPPEFPNPLFTTESVAEPSPDYYMS